MFADAIDVILAIWEREPPYDIDFPGNRYPVSTRTTLNTAVGTGMIPKPYQSPRPEVVGTVVAPHSKGVIAMGERLTVDLSLAPARTPDDVRIKPDHRIASARCPTFN
jgi:hypothetical protein